jgi:F-type H+-transporting ATPase subunit c
MTEYNTMTEFKERYLEALLFLGRSLGGGLATIGLAGAGVGIGIVFGSLVISLALSPDLEKFLFKYAMLGFALTEAAGLLALMVAFLILFS